jgi:hypothetical protein
MNFLYGLIEANLESFLFFFVSFSLHFLTIHDTDKNVSSGLTSNKVIAESRVQAEHKTAVIEEGRRIKEIEIRFL